MSYRRLRGRECKDKISPYSPSRSPFPPGGESKISIGSSEKVTKDESKETDGDRSFSKQRFRLPCHK